MIRPDGVEGADETIGWTDPLAKEGIDTGLARTLLEAVIDGRGGASVDVRDGLKSVMGDEQEAGCPGGVKDDCRRAFVCGGTTRETTGGGRGSSEADNGVVDCPSVDG